jgi:hypothetical protein
MNDFKEETMYKKHNLLGVLLGLILFFPAAGCGDNSEDLYIIVFNKNEIELVPGRSDVLNVELSSSVSKNTYVDIKNDVFCEDKLSIEPTSLTFRQDDPSDMLHQVTFTAIKSTNNQYCKVRIELKDYNDYRIYRVKVTGN